MHKETLKILEVYVAVDCSYYSIGSKPRLTNCCSRQFLSLFSNRQLVINVCLAYINCTFNLHNRASCQERFPLRAVDPGCRSVLFPYSIVSFSSVILRILCLKRKARKRTEIKAARQLKSKKGVRLLCLLHLVKNHL